MNNVETHSWAVLESCAGLNARIDDAGCPPLSEGDLRRMFPGSSLTDRRLYRLRSWLRVVIPAKALTPNCPIVFIEP